MKYKVGDRVRIKSRDWYNENKDEDGNIRYKHGTVYPIFFTRCMSRFCGETVTIKCVHEKSYYMNETGSCEFWTDEMIEGLVEEESSIDLTVKGEEIKERIEIAIPEGYEYVIESGKIIFTKKKKEYPKTFLGCCDVLNIENLIERGVKGYKAELFDTLQKLYICRDAYWKIAGEEMGLGKPWSPSDNNKEPIYAITRYDGYIIKDESGGNDEVLEFPTKEMRDAFYENFKELIELVKELL